MSEPDDDAKRQVPRRRDFRQRRRLGIRVAVIAGTVMMALVGAMVGWIVLLDQARNGAADPHSLKDLMTWVGGGAAAGAIFGATFAVPGAFLGVAIAQRIRRFMVPEKK